MVQPDGRLVVGGTGATATTSSDFAVARYGFLADLDPLAHAGGPYILDEGGDVTLDGSGSTHPQAPDRTIVNYEWDLDYDGATFDTNAYGIRPTVQFLDDFASRTIAIRVTDSEGVQKIATTTLEVDNVAPTLTLRGPESVDVGLPYLLELAASDPGTDTISNWTVNWGDGDVETIPGSPPWATHTFGSGGQVYTISATATDEDGTFTAANTVDVQVLETGARLDGQTLLVTGTAGNDSADLKTRKTRDGRSWLDVNGTFIVGGVASFELNRVAFIQIALGEGDDRARIASQITLPALIRAGGGNDLITAGGGATEVHAGPGDDQVMGGAAADRLFGDDGQDAISGGKGHDALDGGTGSDKLSGGDGNDTVSGGEGADTLYGDAGDDAMYGDGGSDVLDGGPGNDVLVGGAGDDSLLGGSGNDAYGFNADLLLGHDTVADRSGTDTLDFSSTSTAGVIVDLAQTGLQTVIPGNLDVTLSQGTTVENVIGGAANDFLFGNAQANRLDGGLGSDVLMGRAGNDTLLGGSDNDTYYFDAAQKLGTDTVLEVPGGGTDTLDFSTTATVGVTVNLATTGTQTVVSKKLTLSLSAGNVIENVIGGRGADVLIGNALDNVLHGGSGNDILLGGAGDDILLGGPASDDGRDVLFGGSGSDTLRGGGFDDLLFGGNSTYHNETQGTADRVALNAILAEWTSTHAYSDRLRYVFAGGGLNKTFKLDGKLLSDSAADTLFGNDEQDWLLVHDEDLTPDLDPLLETKTALP